MSLRCAVFLLLLLPLCGLAAADDISEAQGLLYREELPAAINKYREILKREPGSEPAHAGLLRALLKNNNVAEASGIAETALKQFPSSAKIYAALGDIFFRKARMKEAQESYRKALQLDPQNARGYYGIFRLHSFSFNRKSAGEMIKRAYGYDPDDPEIIADYVEELPETQKIPVWEKYCRIRYANPDVWLSATQSYYSYVGDQKIWRIPNPPGQAEIRFRNGPGYTVEALINGSKKVALGLTQNSTVGGVLIKSSLAKKLNLKAVTVGRHVAVPKMQIGAIEFEDCLIGTLEDQGFESLYGAVADGVIGLDMFKRYLITVDLPNRSLKLNPLPLINGKSFDDPESWKELDRTKPAELESFVTMGVGRSSLEIPVIVNKKEAGFFGLYVSSTRELDWPFAERVAKLDNRKAFGKFRKAEAKNVSLRLGKFDQKFDNLVVSDLNSRFSNIELAGHLDFSMLRNFAVTIDYRDGLIGFEAVPAK